MARTKPTTEWNRPRYVNTAQLQDVSGNNIQDVFWNDIFVIWQSGAWELVPKINTTWS